MRSRLFAFLLALSVAPSVAAQTSNQLPVGTYAFTVAVPVTECFIDGTDRSTTVQAPQGARFYYLQSADSDRTAVIQFLLWRDPESAAYKTFNIDANHATHPRERKYFCLPRSRFDRFSEKIYGTGWGARELAAGALVLPVKLRIGTNGQGLDFAKDVTFGTAAGPRFRVSSRHESYVSTLVGVGLSSVSLTDANTLGKVPTTTDRSALTFTVGVMGEVEKFQMGVFIGQDRISQPNQADWIHQGKTWLAVGLGYTLFGADKGKNATGNEVVQPSSR